MKYLFMILEHKWFIFIAGFQVGGLSFWRLLIHDWSKFTLTEFLSYRNRFEFNNCSEDEWNNAWLHHIHHNPHHWEHWLLNGNVPIRMPDTYVREMLVDWMAAGRSYKGSWNIQPWIDKNLYKIRLHEDSLRYLRLILTERGFKLPQ